MGNTGHTQRSQVCNQTLPFDCIILPNRLDQRIWSLEVRLSGWCGRAAPPAVPNRLNTAATLAVAVLMSWRS
jgi:hypothetical protein